MVSFISPITATNYSSSWSGVRSHSANLNRNRSHESRQDTCNMVEWITARSKMRRSHLALGTFQQSVMRQLRVATNCTHRVSPVHTQYMTSCRLWRKTLDEQWLNLNSLNSKNTAQELIPRHSGYNCWIVEPFGRKVLVSHNVWVCFYWWIFMCECARRRIRSQTQIYHFPQTQSARVNKTGTQPTV